MRESLRTYTAYSVGVAIVWAAILIGVSIGASDATRKVFYVLFLGWAIGWTSATIARVVYPPPKSQRPW